ncbi:hypothetical protein CAEBREN_11987 [Caenorhabditis brenneri]|uniref:HAT C-terminal dimerisation domain-containing protein n=1 Tax=Caenorhabditis brenneri TaxID=135651 RepID=G0PMR1_CAEBE|nr:hypothetical protein CAEBREN_11987 [Caenorhabditis brenneri]
MEDQKPQTSQDDVKNEVIEHSHETEDKPPNLPPSLPQQRYRVPVTNFVRLKPILPRPPIPMRRHDPYIRLPPYSSVERYNEEVAMRFLFGNGLPVSAIDDEHFLTFLHYLNSTKPPPEAKNMINRTSTEHRPDIKYVRSNGPLCVTIEAIRKNDEVFLSISSHFYNVQGERQNRVHFEKVILADYEGKVVADRIRKVVDANKCQNFGVSYILSPNTRMLKLVTDSMPFKNKFICFFSYLTNMAREAILLPDFSVGLKSLRTFVEALHKHQEVYTKFRQIQMELNINVDLPPLDCESDWLSTLHFLSKCTQLNEIFASIHENWCMPRYLDATEENAMSNLYDLLLMFCHVAAQLCVPESSVSQVYHSMSLLNNAIGNCGIRKAREALLRTFTKYYTSISNGKVGDFYAIAALLDPRYGYSSMIFNEEDWINVENKLLKKLENEKKQSSDVQKEISRYKRLTVTPPSFDEGNTHLTWWNDRRDELPILYQQWVEYSTVPAVSVDGKVFFSKGGKLAHLFATLDEELHLKALFLAQSSQKFIGRGSHSMAVQKQTADIQNLFKRMEQVEEEEEQSMVTDAFQGPETEMKQEIPDDSEGMQENSEMQQDIKEEEPDDYTA